jgi:small nuclear ribonucleoprotein (snRNP)-like protein
MLSKSLLGGRMHRAMLVAITTLAMATPVLHAQTTVPVNSRVRVSMRNGEHVIGRLTEVRGDTLVVIDNGVLLNSKYRIPADRMRRIDVSRGKHVSAGRVFGGALLGALGGYVAANVVPGIAMQCSADVCGTGSGFAAAMLVGIAGGVTLGVLTPADRWEAVPSPVRVGFGGDPGRPRLGVSLSF